MAVRFCFGRLVLHVDPRRIEPVGLQVCRIFLDDADDFDVAERVGQARRIGICGGDLEWRNDLPRPAVFFQRRDVAGFRLHLDVVEFRRVEVGEDLVLLCDARVGLLRENEVDVAAEAKEDDQQCQRRFQAAHGYRLLHQLYTPVPKITAGTSSTDSQVRLFCCVAVRVSRRSSGSFARTEIRFSCCDSQPSEFMKMSRFPSMPSRLFVAKSESPNTTSRVSGFGPSFLSGGLAGSSGAVPVTADASVTGPGLSLPGSSAIFCCFNSP